MRAVALADRVAALKRPAGLLPAIALGGRNAAGQVLPDHGRGAGRRCLERLEVEIAVGRHLDGSVLGALVAQVAGEPASVDARDGADAMAGQPLFQRLLGPPVRGQRREGTEHRTGGIRCVGLHVLRVHADIADMRKREGDDLPGIGRVGQDLLIAGDRGVEHDLRRADAGDAMASTEEHGAIGERQGGGRLGALCGHGAPSGNAAQASLNGGRAGTAAVTCVTTPPLLPSPLLPVK
jgi:hypothetical protein